MFGCDHVLGWLGTARGYCHPALDSGLVVVGHQDILGGVLIYLVPSVIPTLSLRSNHAIGLENFYPLTGVWLVVVAIWMQTPWNIWN